MVKNLKWIKDENLFTICYDIINGIRDNACEDVNFDNIVDPFSALFDVIINEISFDDWLKNEKLRQNQKTLQNMIGTFHQKIIGCVKEWEDLGTGKVIDLCNKNMKIIAEVENKYNTTKGNHKVVIYDDLNTLLNNEYKGFTG